MARCSLAKLSVSLTNALICQTGMESYSLQTCNQNLQGVNKDTVLVEVSSRSEKPGEWRNLHLHITLLAIENVLGKFSIGIRHHIYEYFIFSPIILCCLYFKHATFTIPLISTIYLRDSVSQPKRKVGFANIFYYFCSTFCRSYLVFRIGFSGDQETVSFLARCSLEKSLPRSNT